MNLYILDSQFVKSAILEPTTSLLWTERYSQAGDVSVTIPVTHPMASLLTEGRLLGLEGTQEVMLIESVLIEDGLLKVTGGTLDLFLNNRVVHYPDSITSRDYQWKESDPPGVFMRKLVEYLVMSSSYSINEHGFNGAQQIISNLSLGDIYTSGAYVLNTAPYGPLYDVLKSIAETFSLGFSLYLNSAYPGSYQLKFRVYNGVDRTSDQSVNPLVRFSPTLDNLTNIKELRSVAGYKNIAYAFPPQDLSAFAGDPADPYFPPGVASVNGGDTATDFNLRVLAVFPDNIDVTIYGGDYSLLRADLNQAAKNALINNNYVRMVDGEIVPHIGYKFGVDYNLGDIIELEGYSKIRDKARVTEYIRSQDNTGEREYPTISVIDG